MNKGGPTTAKPWLRAYPPVYVLRNGQVIDVVEGTVSRKDVYLREGRILELLEPGSNYSDASSASSESKDPAKEIDLEGAYLCPGLIDCHVHLSITPGFANLSSLASITERQSLLRQPFLCGTIISRGFTTVRDCGGATAALKEALDDDVFPGPRLFRAGRALSQTGGHGDFRGAHDDESSGDAPLGCCGGGGQQAGGRNNLLARVCDGVPACLAAARDELRKGSDFLKIMAGGGVMSPTDRLENVQFSAAEIAAITEVAASAGTYVTAHAYTPAAVRRCVENGVRGIEHGNLIDESTAALMAARNAFLTPTLVTYKALSTLKSDHISPQSREKNESVLAIGLESIKLADKAGVTICHGSDLLGPFWNLQTEEFAIRSRALSPLKILQGATVNAAKLLMAEDKLGQIKKGFCADMVIMKANPLDNIMVLDKPEDNLLAVFKEGKVIRSRLESLPDYYGHGNVWTKDAIPQETA